MSFLDRVTEGEMPWRELPCRFGCDPRKHPVVGLYFAPAGCWCFTDRIQALCAQHAIKGMQNNDMICIDLSRRNGDDP